MCHVDKTQKKKREDFYNGCKAFKHVYAQYVQSLCAHNRQFLDVLHDDFGN